MPRQRVTTQKKELILDFGSVSDKQRAFLESEKTFTCYGGARGGGKTHVARLKAAGMAIRYPGIRILMVRAHYPELQQNLIDPMLKWIPNEFYSYNATEHMMKIHVPTDDGVVDSIIKFGHYDGKAAENEYQGVEYDVIFLEEATQLSERAFQFLQSCCRGVNDFPKRIYLTCNPGGVGHKWVKDLFILRRFRVDPNNPDRNQNPDDYLFIPATVDDNPWLLKSSPLYIQMLENLPEDLRKAHRYGDWDALSGAYFSNFNEATHTMSRFKIPNSWNVYRAFDYGLDALAVGWFAIDEDGRAWCYRYFQKPGLTTQEAATEIVSRTPMYEHPVTTYAPPDMWNRSKDTGKMIAEAFISNGVSIIKSDNNRVQGHMILRNMMSPMPLTDPYVKSLFPKDKCPSTLPGIMFFDDLRYTDPVTHEVNDIVEDIGSIQADEKDMNDCAKDPHDVTHSVDMCRYFAIMRAVKSEKVKKKKKADPLGFLFASEEEDGDDYQSYMCGGEITEQYIS